MPRYVAFLRAVNVGGRIVKMDELRRPFAAAGFADVETFIASGNVIFDTTAKPGAGAGGEDRERAARRRSATTCRRSSGRWPTS